MIKLIINGHNFSNQTAGLQTTMSEISGGNSFTDINGKEIKDVTGYKFSLKIKLSPLDSNSLAIIFDELNSGNININSDFLNFDGTYTLDGGYNTNVVYNDRQRTEWEIEFTLSRNISASDGGSGDGL